MEVVAVNVDIERQSARPEIGVCTVGCLGCNRALRFAARSIVLVNESAASVRHVIKWQMLLLAQVVIGGQQFLGFRGHDPALCAFTNFRTHNLRKPTQRCVQFVEVGSTAKLFLLGFPVDGENPALSRVVTKRPNVSHIQQARHRVLVGFR